MAQTPAKSVGTKPLVIKLPSGGGSFKATSAGTLKLVEQTHANDADKEAHKRQKKRGQTSAQSGDEAGLKDNKTAGKKA